MLDKAAINISRVLCEPGFQPAANIAMIQFVCSEHLGTANATALLCQSCPAGKFSTNGEQCNSCQSATCTDGFTYNPCTTVEDVSCTPSSCSTVRIDQHSTFGGQWTGHMPVRTDEPIQLSDIINCDLGAVPSDGNSWHCTCNSSSMPLWVVAQPQQSCSTHCTFLGQDCDSNEMSAVSNLYNLRNVAQSALNTAQIRVQDVHVAGEYFNFDAADMDAFVANFSWSNKSFTAINSRTSAVGMVILVRSPTPASPYSAHGTRDVNSARNSERSGFSWLPGDVLLLRLTDTCSRFEMSASIFAPAVHVLTGKCIAPVAVGSHDPCTQRSPIFRQLCACATPATTECLASPVKELCVTATCAPSTSTGIYGGDFVGGVTSNKGMELVQDHSFELLGVTRSTVVLDQADSAWSSNTGSIFRLVATEHKWDGVRIQNVAPNGYYFVAVEATAGGSPSLTQTLNVSEV